VTALDEARDRWAEQEAAEERLAGQDALFTADDEFPPGPAVSRRRRRGPTHTLPDIADYHANT
jgi:hypothetical protein